MNKNSLLITASVITVVSIIIAVLAVYDKNKTKLELREQEIASLRLILERMQQNPNLSNQVKGELEKLAYKFQKVDSKVAKELKKALLFLKDGLVESAITSTVKIIEHLLKKHYEKSKAFKSWLKEKKQKKKSYYNLLSFCKEENKITKEEYHFFMAIKDMRNGDSHEVGFQQDKYLSASGLIFAVGSISKVAKMAYPTVQ